MRQKRKAKDHTPVDKSVLTISTQGNMVFRLHELWVAARGCCICGRSAVSHHENSAAEGHEKGGWGQKCHSKWTMPLCDEHHRQRHDRGHKTFAKLHGINLVIVCRRYAGNSPHRDWEK